ncbi:MAG: zinc ABC transporter substrate-binding protein, partial [Lachnospiraceae bacterium]|nr:zinc ABC transporter substrate-binding protein [Lachnospiraceae bacterium]
MKKCLSILLCVMILSGALSGCGKALASEPVSSGGLRIVTTIFPEYDWVTHILGENPGRAEVTLLLDNGVDLHSFQPTAADILRVATCDLFIHVGGESDEWVEDALKEATNKDMAVINLLDVLGDAVKEEELVEGMQGEEE